MSATASATTAPITPEPPAVPSPARVATVPPTLSALHDAFHRGTLKPSDVVEHWLARPAADRSTPIWISTVAADALRSRAADLDAMLMQDPAAALALPLFGALYAVKDNIDVAGLPTTAACPGFAYRPRESASVVKAIDAAGAIAVGKTNLDQFATGLVGTRSPYGAVPNAFDPSFISGGSSSGSAVAVARGLVHFALGTDTAGSGRVPAALNNIVGWKPTRELMSTSGVVPACRSIDCVSIFALTVADAARVFTVASKTGASIDLRRCAPDRPALHGPFIVGSPRTAQLEFFGDDDNSALFALALKRLSSLGASHHAIDFSPWRAVADMLYDGAHAAERHAGIREFFDAHVPAPRSSVDPSFDTTVRAIIAGARNFSASDAFVASARLSTMKAALASTWDRIDVLVVPTVPTTYSITDVQADPIELNRRLGIYTNFVNLLDLAAIAVPAGFRRDGMPMGITLIGPAGSDLMLAELAQRFHTMSTQRLGALDAPSPPPEPFAARADTARLAVVGAHLTGLPLNRELVERGGRLVRRSRTAPCYRLFALPGTTPPKPGMVRVGTANELGGAPIDVEVWELPLAGFGSMVANVPAPLAIGTIELEDGDSVHGFLCEAVATADAEDISRFGGWRNYLTAKAAP